MRIDYFIVVLFYIQHLLVKLKITNAKKKHTKANNSIHDLVAESQHRCYIFNALIGKTCNMPNCSAQSEVSSILKRVASLAS